MKKIISLIFTYFTVAVLLAVAVIPFYTDAAETVFRDESSFENAEGITHTVYDDLYSDTEKLQKNDEAVSDENSENGTDVTEILSENVTEGNAEDTTEDTAKDTTEDTAEDTTEDTAKDTTEDTTEAVSEDTSEGVIEAEYPMLYDYAPGGENETVTGLNFFTDTYGMLSDKDSVNVYTFTLDSVGVFRYTFNHSETNDGSGWKAELYQEYLVNGTGEEKAYRLINELTTSTGRSDSSPELGLIKGNYRLVVTANGGFNSDTYRISVTHSTTTKYENECNDNIYRYNEIYSDISIKGSASKLPDRQDADYYMFRMYSDGYVELSFSHPEIKDLMGVCWQVIFFSEDMTEMFSVNSTFTEEEYSSGRVGLHAGNYYIAVINRVYTDVTYTLTVKRTEIEGFENERNDTFDTADKINVNSTITGTVASQINGLDRDCFMLEIGENGTLVLEFAHNPISDSDGKKGWNYKLTDKNGTIIFAGVSAWDDDVSASPVIGLAADTYYVTVDSEGLYHSAERYYLSTVFTSADNWETEFNDSSAKADRIKENVEINAVLTDRSTDFDYDWFTFTTKKTSDVNIDFSHEALSYSREIFSFTLYDENMNAVAAADGKTAIGVLSDAKTVTALYKELPAGKYYIKVSTGIFFDTIGYSVLYETVTKES